MMRSDSGDALAYLLAALNANKEIRKMQTVQIGYGKVNFPRRSMTLTGFVVEDGFKRTLVSQRHPKVGRTSVQPVTTTPEIDGNLYTDFVNVPEGTILCLQGSIRANGMPAADAGVFVRVREQGAGLLIKAYIPLGGLVSSHISFSGHGDLLDIDELAAEGITPNERFRGAFMDAEEISEVFDIKEVVPARAAAPKLEVHISDSGKEVKLNVAKPIRRMRIKK